MKISFLILIGIMILLYVIFIEKDDEKKNIKLEKKVNIQNNKNNINNDDNKNDEKNFKKKNIVSNDSLIEEYGDNISEGENIDENISESLDHAIMNNDENFDNVYHTFINANKFSGKKEGYIYKLDRSGLGYYIDEFSKYLNDNNVYVGTIHNKQYLT